MTQPLSAFQFAKMAKAAIAGPPRIFDWARDCPDAVGRVFPAIVGTGRGEVLEPYQCIRCGRESWEPFTLHRPLHGNIRTCSGKVAPRSQVDRARAEEDRKMVAGLLGIARQESGWLA